METTEYLLPDLIKKAAHYAAMAEHCEEDVRIKLRQWGCDSADEQSVIDELVKNNFINNNRYAKAFAHDKLLYQGWGRMKIKAGLLAKYIDEDDIDDSLNNLDEQDYFAILRKVVSKKKTDNREQLIRFLLQRGFTYSEISSIIPS
ncbi:MAG: RecX family transcriptional regulator [Paludibacteraceae bacterium]|nr:RecX family transcriptional regulator [Paludibacteraceae bacterium]